MEKKVSHYKWTSCALLFVHTYKVFDAILKRQTMANLAKDMDTWIEKRDKLSRKIDELKRQKHISEVIHMQLWVFPWGMCSKHTAHVISCILIMSFL
jgi:hypothetical protein